jgi:hypothetical protein
MYPDRGDWGQAEELAALQAELIAEGNRLFIMAHSKPGSIAPASFKFPRPGQAAAGRPARPLSSAEDLRRFFTIEGGRSNGS